MHDPLARYPVTYHTPTRAHGWFGGTLVELTQAPGALVHAVALRAHGTEVVVDRRESLYGGQLRHWLRQFDSPKPHAPCAIARLQALPGVIDAWSVGDRVVMVRLVPTADDDHEQAAVTIRERDDGRYTLELGGCSLSVGPVDAERLLPALATLITAVWLGVARRDRLPSPRHYGMLRAHAELLAGGRVGAPAAYESLLSLLGGGTVSSRIDEIAYCEYLQTLDCWLLRRLRRGPRRFDRHRVIRALGPDATSTAFGAYTVGAALVEVEAIAGSPHGRLLASIAHDGGLQRVVVIGDRHDLAGIAAALRVGGRWLDHSATSTHPYEQLRQLDGWPLVRPEDTVRGCIAALPGSPPLLGLRPRSSLPALLGRLVP